MGVVSLTILAALLKKGVKGQYRLSSAVKCNFTALFNKLLILIKYLTAPKYRVIQLSI